ncbi:MFS transporter [Catenulispora pinisilvae]|uniref:MFS transporter n=1 Tax=Catenulispora pinisilvae TaxID=2705253 RepID=UPI0018917851|nr:MFS transporter [Catenulispora pinisilvae]
MKRFGLHRALDTLGWWEVLFSRGPSRLLAFNSLVDAAGTGLALVCLPFYAIRVAHLSASELGIVLSAGGLCELIAAVPNGAAASRFGVRRFIVATKVLQACAFAGLAFATGVVPMLVLAALAGASRAGSGGLGQSLAVAVLGEQERATILGCVRALRNIGYLLSAGLGSCLLAIGGSTPLRLALLVNAASFLLGALWIGRLRLLRAGVLPERTDWSVLHDVEYLGLIACAAVFGSSLVVLTVGLPLWVMRYPQIPSWTTGCVVLVNTALVVVFQVRFSRRLDTVDRAVRAIWRSALAFAAMAGLLALTAHAPALLAVALIGIAALTLTMGELLESPSWWTLSMLLAPANRRNEYLAAFDLCWALVGIFGSALMTVVVSAGPAGWLCYGAALLAAAAAGRLLASRRAARFGGASVTEATQTSVSVPS